MNIKIRKIKGLFLFLGLTAIVESPFSQNHNHRFCGTDEMVKKSLEENPQLRIKREQLEQFTQEFLSTRQEGESTTFVIPIVFHVIHNYGNENISDAQIRSVLNIINQDFQKLNSDTSQIIDAFRGIIGNPNFEFRLARRDPNGNCTNGITRTASNLTYSAGENVKELISWPRNRYLNVWVVDRIESGAGGYAFLPGSAPSPAQDGIVVNHRQLGNIGTAAAGGNFAARTLTHEIGHWFNLLHTWGFGNTPGQASNCNGDDLVSDTPNTVGVTGISCPLNQNSCNSLDNVQNYMDYSSCIRMFTVGQANRMIAAINSAIGQRNNLWQSSNLVATGTNAGFADTLCAPIADFTANNLFVCAPANVQFTDFTWRGTPTSWNWTVTNGTNTFTANIQNPTIQITEPGVYNVSLTVSNSQGNSTETKVSYLIVRPSGAEFTQLPYEDNFTNNPLTSGRWVSFNGWQQSTAAVSANSSLMLFNFSQPSQDYFLFSPSYDLTIITQSTVRFKYAYARRTNQINETLRLQVSTNCGGTWVTLWQRTGSELQTAGLVPSSFTPTNASQWQEVAIPINPVFANRPNVRFRLEFNGAGGNNLFLDDWNITGVVSVEELKMVTGFNIFPNPAKETVWIDLTLESSDMVNARLVDLSGRVLQTQNFMAQQGKNTFEMQNLSGLTPGVYILEVNFEGKSIKEKLIIQ